MHLYLPDGNDVRKKQNETDEVTEPWAVKTLENNRQDLVYQLISGYRWVSMMRFLKTIE